MALRRGRRWSLHGRQLARHVVSRWVMCGLRGVIAMGTLLFGASVLRGLTAIRLSSSRRGRARLLRGRLVLPLAEALGTDRRGPVIMLVAMKRGLRSSGGSRLRWRSSGLHVARPGGVLLRIRRLVLRISRLWRGHAVVVHRAQLRPGAVVPIRHQRRWSRGRSVYSIGGRRRSRRSRCRGWAAVVGISNARWWLRGWWQGLLLRWWRWRVVQWRRCSRSHHRTSRPCWTALPRGILVLSHLLLLARARLTRKRWRGWSPQRLTTLLIRIWRLRRRVHFRKPRPIAGWSRRRAWWRLGLLGTGSRVGPLRTWWPDGSLVLVCLGMDISWHRSRTGAVSLAVTKKLQPGLDVRIGRVQLGRSLIGIQCIINLVIAALILKRMSAVCTAQVLALVATYQSAKVIPDL